MVTQCHNLWFVFFLAQCYDGGVNLNWHLVLNPSFLLTNTHRVDEHEMIFWVAFEMSSRSSSNLSSEQLQDVSVATIVEWGGGGCAQCLTLLVTRD